MAVMDRFRVMFSRRRKADGKRVRGASMVEFAIVSPLFFFVVFAAIESGLMFRTNIVLEDMARSGGRAGSIARNDLDADEQIIRRISDADSALPGDIKKVIIFEAASLDQEVPANCLLGAPTAQCSTYDANYADILTTHMPSPGWVAANRDEGEFIGVYVEYDYNFVTGFLGDITLTSTSVQVVELNA